MSARIPVQLSENPYEVIVGNETLGKAGNFIAQVLKPGKCALVTDSNVVAFYADAVERSLSHAGFTVTRIVVPAGEESKAMPRAEEICDKMIEAGLDRGSSVVALGGGVVGDLAGFAAGIFYRGIPCVQIPTTVVAQVDSAIGGKTGVNSRMGKNLIGAFHQPAIVIADPSTLKTLPKREFNEGFAEIIKHASIADPDMLKDLADFHSSDLPSLIARNVKIKARVVVGDEFEQSGLRALLNFGHTIGHAIENTAGYGRYLHGEAISLGLAAALYLSEKKAGLAPESSALVLKALKEFDLPTLLPEDLATEALMQALSRDKKFEGGAIRFVLVPELGQAFVSKDVTSDDLREAIEKIRA
jgi:3-dehydroquinate synthase